MSCFISGIRITGLRSFGLSVEVTDFSKINLFIGKNNAGKSNLIRAIRIAEQVPSGGLETLAVDFRRGENLCIQLEVTKEQFRNSKLGELLFKNLSSDLAAQIPTERIWHGIEMSSSSSKRSQRTNVGDVVIRHLEHQAKPILNVLGINSSNIKRNLEQIGKELSSRSELGEVLPKLSVVSVPHFRQITNDGEKKGIVDGSGLVRKLLEYQSPKLGNEEQRDQFDRISRFVGNILNEPDARIEIPHDGSNILVRMHGKRLPLESYGTGTHQIVLMAALVTLHSGVIVTIEEPELYLHPELQKKFLIYLSESTDNQYFITTHSNAVLDVPGSSVYHVVLEPTGTHIVRVDCFGKHGQVLQDLGYTASDLLQSNCVIWVEGPSDRIYIKHWIDRFIAREAIENPATLRLIEGIHYNIMFYGGGLIAHLDCGEPAYRPVSETTASALIELRRMNRNSAVVFDSDKVHSAARIKRHQSRIKNELLQHGGVCWVTAGREIENYVGEDVFSSALSVVHPSKKDLPTDFGQYIRISCDSHGRSLDKVTIAREVAKMDVDWSRLDLQARVRELVAFIRRSNHISG